MADEDVFHMADEDDIDMADEDDIHKVDEDDSDMVDEDGIDMADEDDYDLWENDSPQQVEVLKEDKEVVRDYSLEAVGMYSNDAKQSKKVRPKPKKTEQEQIRESLKKIKLAKMKL